MAIPCKCEDRIHWFAVIDLQSLAAGECEFAWVKAEQVQDGRVQVGDVVPVFDGVESESVGGTVDDALLDSAAGKPDGEPVRMVIPARPFRSRRAAELRPPNYQRFVQ